MLELQQLEDLAKLLGDFSIYEEIAANHHQYSSPRSWLELIGTLTATAHGSA